MAKTTVNYSCTECGAISPKWSGQCGDCGAWNTLVEIVAVAPAKNNPRFAGFAGDAGANQVQMLDHVTPDDVSRNPTGIEEFDRVLGGGLVPGSVVLIGGDPGIGKSTLLLQTVVSMAQQQKTLYITGEESLQQVSMRSHRLGLPGENVELLAETRVENIIATAEKEKPQVLVIDSIQTVYSICSRCRSTGKRECCATGALCQANPDSFIPGRACHQGRHSGRTSCTGTHGGHGPLF